MAGVKGRSGGARPGAGRKPKPKGPPVIPVPPVAAEKAESGAEVDRDMLQLLQAVALGRVEATALQVRAAIAAVQYTHAKVGEGGKKDAAAVKAKKAGAGKFASAPPPKLVVNNK